MAWRSMNKAGVEDLTLLEAVTEENILRTLQNRYKEDLIYTNIGPVLVSVNPFKNLSIYTQSSINTYCGRYLYELPPHIFGLAEDTYRSMLTEKENQCIIISGESGSGKTEASKKIMQYIAAVSGSSIEVERVKDQLLESNPLLEAFGNAKTVRNNNSSRFGKYLEIQFNFAGDPIGGRITNYLLEKSRVVHQAKDERNFHFFYQLLAGASTEDASELCLGPPESYHYLNQSGCYTVNDIDDRTDFKDTTHAMGVIGIHKDEQKDILRLVAAILHLGNITFSAKPDGKAYINSKKEVTTTAKLLRVPPDMLERALVNRQISTGQGKRVSTYAVPLTVEEAVYTRDALAKAIYSRIFDFIIRRCNQSIYTEKPGHVIGVLDIYGFEIFDTNSFEQFCINFCNEKLQQIFIELTLKAEQEEYMREKITWTPVEYFNNKIVCDLIEKRPVSCLALLDEECVIPEGSDKRYLEKLVRNFEKHNHFAKEGVKGSATAFTIKHYAGDVTYDVLGFTDKNKDTLFPTLIQLCLGSSSPLLKTIFAGESIDQKQRPVTAGTQFKNQVNDLMRTLMSCTPHYVRCIKPNGKKRAMFFEEAIVLHQIRYLGLLENVRVRRAGFAYRQTFEKFLHRYKMLSPDTWPIWSGSAMDGCTNILKQQAITGDLYQFGTSKVFIRAPVTLFALEELRDRRLHDIATIIQKTWRAYKVRKYFLELRALAMDIFLNKKQRRRASIGRNFYGDYLRVADDANMGQSMRKRGDRRVLFSDTLTKINRKFKAQQRSLVITDRAIYNITGKRYGKPNRRIPLDVLGSVSLSTLTDNYFVVHVPSEYDYIYESDRKTEIVTALAENFHEITGKQLPVNFSNDIIYRIKKGEARKLHILEKTSVLQTAFHIDASGDITIEVAPTAVATKEEVLRRHEQAELRRPPQRSVAGAHMVVETPTPAKHSTASSSSSESRTFPPPIPRVLRVKAEYDYQATSTEELSFQAGDVITVKSQEPSGWWVGETRDRCGFFPSNYVTEVKAGSSKALPAVPPKPKFLS